MSNLQSAALGLWNVTEYHRPRRIEEALQLLSRRSPRTVALAGGTRLVGQAPDWVEAVVDLRFLGLSYMKYEEDTLHLGAMTTLQELVDAPYALRLAGGILHEGAQRAAGRNLRHQSTLGGTVAAGAGNDPLLTVLLALKAELVLWTTAKVRAYLSDYLAQRQGLIIELRVPLGEAMRGAYEQVGRTPRDQPIVCAAAVSGPEGLRVAVGGLGPRPVLAEELAGLAPPSDFLASGAYRRQMAEVLVKRVLGTVRVGV